MEAQVEAARYRLPFYADAHWLFQMLAAYRDSCSGRKDMANIRAAVCEKVLHTFCRVGVKPAKKLAARFSTFKLPGWVPLSDEGWAQTRQAMQQKLREERQGD